MTIGGSPGQLTRFGAHQAAVGLGGVEVRVYMRSYGSARGFGRLGLSRRPGPAGVSLPAMVSEDRIVDVDPSAVSDAPAPIEVLHFACNGVVIRCATADAPPGAISPGGPGLSGSWSSIGAKSELFRGYVRANPRFLYEDVRLSELLLTLNPDMSSGSTWGTAAALMEVSSKLARSAQVAQAPILYMQSPVAPYQALSKSTRGDGSFERPRPAGGVVLRAAIGVDARFPERRIALEADMAQFAEDSGLGMEVRDRRPGMVRGDWFTVVKQDDGGERFGQYMKDLVGASADEPIQAVRPITIVGPGRIGSSATCLGLLNSLGSGLCGISITASQDIALINLVLADRGIGPRGVVEAEVPQRRVADYQDLEAGLEVMARTAVRSVDFRGVEQTRALEEAAGDYVVLAGRRRQVAGPGMATPNLQDEAWAIWASWDLPAGTVSFDAVAGSLIKGLTAECQAVAPDQTIRARLDYARSRVMSGGRIKGRAKMSVDVMTVPPEINVQVFLDSVCRQAETRTRELLRSAVARNGGWGDSLSHAAVLPGDVRLEWRERWLGHVAPVM